MSNKFFNLYIPSGYVNIKGILEMGYPFNFIWGGRGTGKTYGALKTAIEDHKIFMYTRSKQVQTDMVNQPEFSPFKKLNSDNDWNIQSFSLTKYNSAFYHAIVDENGKNKPDGLPLGYTSALSTIANLRGFDASDVTLWIYDEFIPEKTEKPVKNACFAFLNAYETMNRNREIQGKPPIQCLLFSNSENLSCDIFARLGLIRKVSDMTKNHKDRWYDRKKGIALFNLTDSPISQEKKKTSLYNMVGEDSDFYKMSIENDFYAEDYSDISPQNLKQYAPLVTIGELTIYDHKSGEYLYITKHRSGSPETYTLTDRDITAFKRAYNWVWESYIDGYVKFEDIESKILLDMYFHM